MCVPQTRRQFLGAFANWVLENNSIEFEGVKHHQVIGTAMGTIFSVMFANIFMLWLETPIVEKHKEGIESYKRFLDDILLKEKSCLFKKEINLAHPNIKFTWSGYYKTDGYDLYQSFKKFVEETFFQKKGFCTFTSSPALRTFVPNDFKAALLLKKIK